jgi:hypothetical protein
MLRVRTESLWSVSTVIYPHSADQLVVVIAVHPVCQSLVGSRRIQLGKGHPCLSVDADGADGLLRVVNATEPRGHNRRNPFDGHEQ